MAVDPEGESGTDQPQEAPESHEMTTRERCIAPTAVA